MSDSTLNPEPIPQIPFAHPEHPAGSGRRNLDDKPTEPPIPLTPGSPRQKELVDSFKQVIAQHIGNKGDKTTGEFMDELALDLWRLTRRR